MSWMKMDRFPSTSHPFLALGLSAGGALCAGQKAAERGSRGGAWLLGTPEVARSPSRRREEAARSRRPGAVKQGTLGECGRSRVPRPQPLARAPNPASGSPPRLSPVRPRPRPPPGPCRESSSAASTRGELRWLLLWRSEPYSLLGPGFSVSSFPPRCGLNSGLG